MLSSRNFSVLLFFFFFNDTATTEIYTLSLHDALPISLPTPTPPAQGHPSFREVRMMRLHPARRALWLTPVRSEEHTSELQSPCNLVCRLLLEKKKNIEFSLLMIYEQHVELGIWMCLLN